LKKKADLNAINRKGRTPLHEACSSASKELISLLVKNGADIKKISVAESSGCMHLVCASENINKSAIQAVIDSGFPKYAILSTKENKNTQSPFNLARANSALKDKDALLLSEKGKQILKCLISLHFDTNMPLEEQEEIDIIYESPLFSNIFDEVQNYSKREILLALLFQKEPILQYNTEKLNAWIDNNTKFLRGLSSANFKIWAIIEIFELDNKLLEYCIEKGKCTKLLAENRYLVQSTFHCRTCNLDENEGICATCVVACHNGHDVVDMDEIKIDEFACGCAVLSNNTCLCKN